MAIRGLLLASVLLCFLASTCSGEVHFSDLKDSKTLIVRTTNLKDRELLKAGENDIDLTWSLDPSFPAGTDSNYRRVKAKLCFAPISQQDRAWRKTEDNLKKDKTCQFDIVDEPYKPTNNNFTYTVERDIPTGSYFVRVYAYDSNGHEVAYGQSTDDSKQQNLFSIQAISGRHATLDICSVCFSVFSVVSLFGFFYMEKRQGKRAAAQQK